MEFKIGDEVHVDETIEWKCEFDGIVQKIMTTATRDYIQYNIKVTSPDCKLKHSNFKATGHHVTSRRAKLTKKNIVSHYFPEELFEI